MSGDQGRGRPLDEGRGSGSPGGERKSPGDGAN